MRSKLMVGTALILWCLFRHTAFCAPSGEPATSVYECLTALMNGDVESAMKIAQPDLPPDIKARMRQGFSAMAGEKVTITKILEVQTEKIGERNRVPTAVVYTRIELRYLRNNDAVVRESRWYLIKVDDQWRFDGGGL